MAAATVTTTADATMSADTAGGTYTALNGPVLSEGAAGDISLGTITLNVPGGFRFDPAAVVTATVTRLTGTKNPITLSGTVTVTATAITITVTKADDTGGGAPTSRITWAGIRVRPLAGTPLASANITYSGSSTISGVSGGTSFGALNETVGSPARLFVTLPNQTFTSGVGNSGTATTQTAGTAFNLARITATDQFTNITTSYSGTKTISYSGPGTSPNGLLPIYTTSVDFANGQSTTTLATTLKKSETPDITANDGVLTGIASSSFTVQPGTSSVVKVESAADGTGTLIPPQNIMSGSSITSYSIARDNYGNFIANIAADSGGWILVNTNGGVVSSDLVPAADRKSAVLTGHIAGSAQIRAVTSGLVAMSGGTLTIVPAPATQVRVETAADGSGSVVPAQSIMSGSSITVSSISRDANGNFVANVAADSGGWTLQGKTGAIADGDLVPAADRKSAVFTGHFGGTAVIRSTSGSLTRTDSGTITVISLEPNPTNSTVTASPTSNVTADGNAYSTITVTLRDSLSNAVPGKTVTLSVNGTGNTISTPAVTDANGQTTATLRSTKAELKTISASVGQTGITQQATVAFVAGAVNLTNSTVVASPTNVLADGGAASTITVTLKDAFNNVVSGQAIGLDVDGTDNTLSTPTLTDTNGQSTATLRSTVAETKLVTASYQATALAQQASVVFVPGPVNSSHSVVVASPTNNIVADGTASSTITVMLRDANNNPIPAQTVTLAASGTGNTLSSPALTDANGQTTATIKSTKSGTKTIVASVGATTILQEPGVTFVAGVVDSANSTVSASPTNDVMADDSMTATITVTLKDANNNAIPGQMVTLSASGSDNSLSTPALTDLNGQTTALLSSFRAETKTVTASVGATAILQTAIVTFIPGAVSGSSSTVTASPATNVTADGVASSTITVILKDANNNVIPGRTVVLAASGTGNTLSTPALTDTNGQTTATLKSTKAETKTITATVGATTLVQQPTVVFVSGALSPTNSTVVANPTNNVTADGIAFSTIAIVLRDANNNAVPGQTVTLAASGTGNTLSSAAPTDLNGQTTAQLKSVIAGSKTVTASVGAVTIPQTATVTFVPGPADPVTSSVSANPRTNVTANGTATSTITVILRDANNNLIPGQTVSLSASGTGNTLSTPAQTDANGQTTAILKSTKAETKAIVATVGATTLIQQPTVIFVPGPISPTNSTVVANPTNNVTADGFAFSTITVVLKDANSNGIPGQTVQLSITGDGNLQSGPGATDSNGQTTALLRSVRAESKTITANVGAAVILQTASVVFVPGPPNGSACTVTVSTNNNVRADGVASVTVTITAKDAGFNLISGQTVTLSASGTSNIFSTPALTDTNGQTTATFQSTTAEIKTLSATVGATAIVQHPTVIFVPGPLDHYQLTATSPQRAGTAFNITVRGKDLNDNTVTSNNTTVVTMSGTGNVQFDGNGNGIFGEANDNQKTLSNGVFNISTKDVSVETVTITATDANSSTGGPLSITVLATTSAILDRPVPQPGGAMKITGVGSAGQIYQLLTATNLASGPTFWLTIGTNVANTNGVISFIDSNAPAYPSRMYRVMAP